MAVIKSLWSASISHTGSLWRGAALVLWLTALLVAPASAEVLPEDRADALYHAYDGGGVTVTGPSLLVRKSYKDKVSVYANYYVDMISSASIDVLSQGSKYSEERTEYSLGGDLLVDNALLSVGYTESDERDYLAKSYNLSVSQTFFGDLTTLSLGYARGDDTVKRNDYFDGVIIDTPTVGHVDRRRFSISLSQILTRNWILSVNAESVVDDGYLRNPYRNMRAYDTSSDNPDMPDEVEDLPVQWAPENYPTSRNSDAFALRSMVYLPYRASLRAEARVFQDSWGIEAHNVELRYTHPLSERMLFEIKGRAYSQTQADFYSDIFSYVDPIGTEHRARDKELSTFDSFNLGFGVTYELGYKIRWVDRQTLGFYWNFMHFDYDNYRNQLLSEADGPLEEAPYDPGEEPLYSFQANVLRLYLSFYY